MHILHCHLVQQFDMIWYTRTTYSNFLFFCETHFNSVNKLILPNVQTIDEILARLWIMQWLPRNRYCVTPNFRPTRPRPGRHIPQNHNWKVGRSQLTWWEIKTQHIFWAWFYHQRNIQWFLRHLFLNQMQFMHDLNLFQKLQAISCIDFIHRFATTHWSTLH